MNVNQAFLSKRISLLLNANHEAGGLAGQVRTAGVNHDQNLRTQLPRGRIVSGVNCRAKISPLIHHQVQAFVEDFHEA
jgi:hypothetical protein